MSGKTGNNSGGGGSDDDGFEDAKSDAQEDSEDDVASLQSGHNDIYSDDDSDVESSDKSTNASAISDPLLKRHSFANRIGSFARNITTMAVVAFSAQAEVKQMYTTLEQYKRTVKKLYNEANLYASDFEKTRQPLSERYAAEKRALLGLQSRLSSAITRVKELHGDIMDYNETKSGGQNLIAFDVLMQDVEELRVSVKELKDRINAAQDTMKILKRAHGPGYKKLS